MKAVEGKAVALQARMMAADMRVFEACSAALASAAWRNDTGVRLEKFSRRLSSIRAHSFTVDIVDAVVVVVVGAPRPDVGVRHSCGLMRTSTFTSTPRYGELRPDLCISRTSRQVLRLCSGQLKRTQSSTNSQQGGRADMVAKLLPLQLVPLVHTFNVCNCTDEFAD
jgi:hypothetical protein